MARRSNSRPLDDPYPQIVAPNLSVVGGTDVDTKNTGVTFEDGAMKIEHGDGSVTIDFDPQDASPSADDVGFGENIAKHLSGDRLAEISTDLIEGITRDIESRKEWLDTRTLGISLLGLKLEKPRSDAGTSSAPLEGMSTVRNPLLLEATVNFQATARAELLPAAGPVKVRNDSPPPPVNQDTNAQQDLADSLRVKDDLATALEKDLNHYLTSVATEYIPDTDRMLFYIGFGGDGFKKVYNCPLRRRPVSESVDAEDLIVSNASTDLQNCGRVTHRIHMRPSTLRRMQIMGVYRDVSLSQPPPPQPDTVDKKKEEIAGQRSSDRRAKDRDYEIYETYCELDLPEFAPEEFKGKGLPLPYRVTLEKESRQILDIRRNWEEDDTECLAKQFFVQFPFIRGLGFYGLGFIHILGNTTNALTAAWREILDAGMFASFPGFLYSKGAGRQNSNVFRVAPGSGLPIDIGAQDDLRKVIMPLPYKDPSGAFINFIQQVNETGRRLAATANVGVGEGKQDAPVGTTLALLEQASKVIDSAHKRLHAAQAEEFKLLKCRFREDPESFWRHKKTTKDWKKEQFIEALNKCDLVPVSDPNNPTYLHRLAKSLAILQLSQAAPDLYDTTAVHMRVLQNAEIDPSGLFRAQPAAPPPDPRMIAIQQKAAAQQQQNQIQMAEVQLKSQDLQSKLQDKQADRVAKDQQMDKQLQMQDMKIKQEQIIHAQELRAGQQEMDQSRQAHAHDLHMQTIERMQDLHHNAIEAQHEARGGLIQAQHDMAVEHAKAQGEIATEHMRHQAELQREAEKHDMAMEHQRQINEEKLKEAKAVAKIKAKQAAQKPKPQAKSKPK